MKRFNVGQLHNKDIFTRKPSNEVVKIISRNTLKQEVNKKRLEVDKAKKHYNRLGAKIKRKVRGPLWKMSENKR